MSSFKDKVVIITGSSSGIGQDCAVLFAEHGAAVVIHGQSAERIRETEKLLKAAGIKPEKTLTIMGSLEDDSTLNKLIDQTVAKFGRIDVLVNNAGVMQNTSLKIDSVENFDYVFKVNLRSAIVLTQLALPYLEKTKGNVINVSSIGSLRANTHLMYYAMSKAAMDHFTKSAAVLYASKGIRVNGVLPGGIDTNFLTRHGIPEETVRASTQAYANQFIPLKRFGKPREISNAVKFLASEEASYVSGALFVVDGANVITAPSLDDLLKK